MMDILFLLTGFVCAIAVPLLNLEFLGFKGFLYSFIMIIFAFVVFSYVILSVFKLKISKIDYLKSKTIVSWNVEYTTKSSRLPYIISLILGILFGIFVYFKNVGLVASILLSLACAFTVLGWWLMGIKRLESKFSEINSFLLSHMGIIYKGKVDVFNGYSKGITEAKRKDNLLILSILKNKKNEEIKLDIPSEKSDEIDAFINDLKNYFDGENNEG